jgi:hypothetical protein
VAEAGWRSPGEVWRAYALNHPDEIGDDGFPLGCGDDAWNGLLEERRLTADEQVAAQVLDARIDRAGLERMADGAVDRYHEALRALRALPPLDTETLARLEHFERSGGRDLV